MKNNEIKILALDSTAEVSTVCLSEGKRLLCEITVNTGNTHSETLLPTVEQALRLTGLSVDDIDVFACSTSPGSFTGVRIGASTVKGLAYGRGKPCVSVSTLEALAYNISGYNGILCPVMDARRSQVYNALFECSDGEITRLCPDRAIPISELDGELFAYEQSIFLSGDGYNITEKGFTRTKISYVPERQRCQSAYSVAMTALKKYERGEYVSESALVPTYLRPSQAERERQARLDANSRSEVK